MKVSIIVPCFNVAEFIEKTIQSFANQTLNDFEVIFIDDLSTDDSFNVINNYIKKYKLNGYVVKNSTNTGPSLARKMGIDMAQGDYCAFCDSDDWYDAQYLEFLYDATLNQKNDIVFCNYRVVYSNGKILERDSIGDVSDFKNKHCVLTIGIDSLCTGLYRRILLKDIIFPKMRNGEDMAILPILIATASEFGFVKKPLYNYFHRAGSLSTSHSVQVLSNLKYSFDFICSNIDKNNYGVEIEYLGIRNYLYSVVLSSLKLNLNKKEITKIISSFEDRFPLWKKNKYIKILPTYKRVFIMGVYYRWFYFLKILSKIHTLISK